MGRLMLFGGLYYEYDNGQEFYNITWIYDA